MSHFSSSSIHPSSTHPSSTHPSTTHPSSTHPPLNPPTILPTHHPLSYLRALAHHTTPTLPTLPLNFTPANNTKPPKELLTTTDINVIQYILHTYRPDVHAIDTWIQCIIPFIQTQYWEMMRKTVYETIPHFTFLRQKQPNLIHALATSPPFLTFFLEMAKNNLTFTLPILAKLITSTHPTMTISSKAVRNDSIIRSCVHGIHSLLQLSKEHQIGACILICTLLQKHTTLDLSVLVDPLLQSEVPQQALLALQMLLLQDQVKVSPKQHMPSSWNKYVNELDHSEIVWKAFGGSNDPIKAAKKWLKTAEKADNRSAMYASEADPAVIKAIISNKEDFLRVFGPRAAAALQGWLSIDLDKKLRRKIVILLASKDLYSGDHLALLIDEIAGSKRLRELVAEKARDGDIFYGLGEDLSEFLHLNLSDSIFATDIVKCQPRTKAGKATLTKALSEGLSHGKVQSIDITHAREALAQRHCASAEEFTMIWKLLLDTDLMGAFLAKNTGSLTKFFIHLALTEKDAKGIECLKSIPKASKNADWYLARAALGEKISSKNLDPVLVMKFLLAHQDKPKLAENLKDYLPKELHPLHLELLKTSYKDQLVWPLTCNNLKDATGLLKHLIDSGCNLGLIEHKFWKLLSGEEKCQVIQSCIGDARNVARLSPEPTIMLNIREKGDTKTYLTAWLEAVTTLPRSLQYTPVLLQMLNENLSDYQMQLLLGILSKTQLPVSTLVDLLRSSQSPQLQNTILSALSKQSGDSLIKSLMPIFTFVGQHTLRMEDPYAHSTVSRVVERILPHAYGKTDLMNHILSIFINAYKFIPPHRRSSTYMQLAKQLGVTETIHIVQGLEDLNLDLSVELCVGHDDQKQADILLGLVQKGDQLIPSHMIAHPAFSAASEATAVRLLELNAVALCQQLVSGMQSKAIETLCWTLLQSTHLVSVKFAQNLCQKKLVAASEKTFELLRNTLPLSTDGLMAMNMFCEPLHKTPAAKSVLAAIPDIIAAGSSAPLYAAKCLATTVKYLNARTLTHLSNILNALLLWNTWDALIIVVKTMPRFVSTHLGRLLTSAPSVQQITAQVVEPRVLFPALAKTNVEECLPALAAALELTESVQEYHIQLYEQFMKGFERATTPEILSAFADYVLKLKESDFTNIFTRMLVWSRKNKDHTYRFYVIINTLWTRMESLFMPYYCRTTDLSVDVLNTCIKAKQASPVRTEVMTSLLNSFKLDQSKQFSDTQLTAFIGALLAQSELGQETLLSDCLVQLCLYLRGTAHEMLWKPLMHQTFKLAKHSSSRIRVFGFEVIDRMFASVGQPLLSELAANAGTLLEGQEDDHHNVEMACNQAIATVEGLLGGETLKSYLN